MPIFGNFADEDFPLTNEYSLLPDQMKRYDVNNGKFASSVEGYASLIDEIKVSFPIKSN